jgi:hypothetical protein
MIISTGVLIGAAFATVAVVSIVGTVAYQLGDRNGCTRGYKNGIDRGRELERTTEVTERKVSLRDVPMTH